jgi:squalene-associated FAD-dependent desaturase
VAVIGAGWAGLAGAVAAARAGDAVTLFEATRTLGGRARGLPVQLPDGSSAVLDNGQHILIGAYSHTLRMMREVGIDPAQVLLRMPLTLRFPDGLGLALPDWPTPWDAVAGIVRAKGWNGRDKFTLLRTAACWRRSHFQCDEDESVGGLCRGLTSRVMAELIEPLCLSALNTPASRSSARVFLRIVGDALFGPREGAWGASNLLLPRCDLGRLFPEAASQWLERHGATIHTGRRVQALLPEAAGWRVDDERFDRVVLACPAREAARLVDASRVAAKPWVERALGLEYEAIATVYAMGLQRLPLPLLALRSGPDAPAQFVFDRGQLGGPAGLLAFVVSAAQGDQDSLQRQVMAQAAALGWRGLQPIQTVVERRATFACTPGLRRPPAAIAPGLWACGDYVDGPYPATLEGAVRSALEAVNECRTTGLPRT